MLVASFAAALGGVQLLGWRLSGFRIDAIYAVVALHATAALITTAVLVAIRRASRASPWSARIVLVMLPLFAAVSCDRLALLAYPPARRDPSAALFEPHSKRRWTLRPGAAAPSLGITINDRGYRGPEVASEKEPGERRMVILGDSVAFGFGVPDDAVFDRVAARRLRESGVTNVRIVNLSVPGYAPWQHVDQLRNEGLAFEPERRGRMAVARRSAARSRPRCGLGCHPAVTIDH